MARAATRREFLLIGVLGVAALVWMFLSGGEEAPQTVAARRAQEKAQAFPKAPVVHMEMLDKSIVAYDAKGRDVFKYATRPPSMAEYRRMKEEAARAKKQAEEMAKAQAIAAEKARLEEEERQKYLAAHPPPTPPPVPPPITFTFLGYVGPASDRIAAFEENNQTFVAKTGDVVKNNFKIQEIRYESVVIAYVDPRFKGQSRELALSRGR
ncbi:MAG TPA: hypothetical protein VJ826_02440 [Candidatus Polarisedimenticolaceae bacterium]|nr:hypothetical protein [Candidatus Polarisedimenticolaceae bacterium]